VAQLEAKMSKYRKLLILSVIVVLVEVPLRPQTSAAQTDSPQLAQARAACASDLQRLCARVQPGGGRIIACLKQHKDEVSDGCKQAILSAMGQSSGAAGSATRVPPAAAKPSPSAANPTPAAGGSRRGRRS